MPPISILDLAFVPEGGTPADAHPGRRPLADRRIIYVLYIGDPLAPLFDQSGEFFRISQKKG